MANTIGSLVIESSISGVTTSPFDNPIKTSAFCMASSSVFTSLLVANFFFWEVRLSLSFLITPLLSHIIIFSIFAPNLKYKRVHEIAAAPAPLTTIWTLEISFAIISKAFFNAAAEIIAVPCWSSCITGIFNSSLSLLSISKASGAFISSKLIPPNVGAIALTVSTNLSTSVASISISKTSISANILKSNPFPSITGLEAKGPISPNPKTAVPLVITATKFPLAVYLYAFFWSFEISRHGSATPGEYAKAKSCWVAYFFVGITSIFPGLGFAWYSKASCLFLESLI